MIDNIRLGDTVITVYAVIADDTVDPAERVQAAWDALAAGGATSGPDGDLTMVYDYIITIDNIQYDQIRLTGAPAAVQTVRSALSALG